MFRNMLHHFSSLFIVFYVSYADAFEVKVPKKQVVAVHGSPTILGCTFTPPPSLQDVVVTWQRVEDHRVVHSFYYGTDQLGRQCPDYKGRTSLYHEQLPSGNASLKLTRAGPGDTGRYLCSVSTAQGTDKAEVHLSYAVVECMYCWVIRPPFFTEPRLSILAHNSNYTLQYESLGYPEPEIRWIALGQNLTHSTQVLKSDEDPDLLKLHTQVVVNTIKDLNWTFTVVNHPLGQVIERSVSLFYDDQRDQVDCSRERLALLCPIAFCVIGLIILFWGRKIKC